MMGKPKVPRLFWEPMANWAPASNQIPLAAQRRYKNCGMGWGNGIDKLNHKTLSLTVAPNGTLWVVCRS